ncbi:hypothetical protein GCM10023321_40040 [Pseudonocardia eucalypti]|uniref:Uncharacterized protein n=1 Tax=Pseudonocardia eucalypti TaxID=648755 RepID=A0ABP9QBL9_9PSEU
MVVGGLGSFSSLWASATGALQTKVSSASVVLASIVRTRMLLFPLTGTRWRGRQGLSLGETAEKARNVSARYQNVI